MEPSLRQAEREYIQTGTLESLERYNVLLRRASLELVRPQGGFLEAWADHLASIIPPTGACAQEIEEGLGPWVTGVFFGTIIKDGVPIDIEITIYEEDEPDEVGGDTAAAYIDISYIAPSRDGLLLNSPRCLLDFRVGPDSIEIRRDLPWHSSSAYGRRRSPTIPNNFINPEELFEYGLRRSIRCAKRLFTWTKARLSKDVNGHNLTEYLVIRLALGEKPLQRRDPFLDEIFGTEWFQNILYNFARELEDYVAHEGLLFDNEGGWPISISSHGGYSLSVKTGYNDTVDPSTEEEIDSNIQGEQRGHAYDVLDKFAEILYDYDRERSTPMYVLHSDVDRHDEGWEGDSYELYEVPEEGEFDISFELGVSRELTVPYVLHLLRSFG